MKPGNFSKEPLNSSAHLSKIRIFIPRRVDYKAGNLAVFTPYRFQDPYALSVIKEEGIIRNFPMLFRGNGEPWDVGNLYLMHEVSERAKFERITVETFETHAVHLLAFLRWLEHSQAEGNNINEFTFPDDPHERVTYAYRRYLMRQIRKTPPPISLGVAKARMGMVVNFYRSLINGKLVDASLLSNHPYEERVAGIPYINRTGLMRIKEVLTTDLAIKIPRRDSDADTEHLNDGGKLRPLDPDEQRIITDALEAYGNRVFELMILFACTTGARKQTVCTLRIHHIKNLLEKQSGQELKLKVGAGSEIDVKSKGNLKHYLLHIPRPVAQMLLDYSKSIEAKNRRDGSFYGDSGRNYIFLTQNGTPYYTSRTEILDREDPSFSSRIAPENRINFPIARGRALNNLIHRLLEKIRQQHPDFKCFRFHDTRATYGMNYVRHFIDKGHSPSKVVIDLSARMGHADPSTTHDYLSYDSNRERVDSIEDSYSAWLEINSRQGSS